jgi:putative ABC transport system permease protein
MNTFLKISFRHLWQSRLYAVINIVGLATGITCMLLAVLYWNDEHSFDNFHTNNSNLYRVTTTLIDNKNESPQTIGGTGQVQGPAFKREVPEVKSFARIMGGDIYSDVISNDKGLRIKPLFADSNFFNVFSFKIIHGNAATALSNVYSAVLTESTARKFFNTDDVVGKPLSLDADPSFHKLGRPLIITTVVKDPPANSSLQFDAMFSFQFMELSFPDNNWLNAYLGTFVVLDPGANLNSVIQKFDAVYASHSKEQLAQTIRLYGYNPQVSYGLQPITDIHLNPLMRGSGNAEGGIVNVSNPVYSYMFLGIAFFIMLMASINFINITIANSLKRSKEVSIRKISGGSRGRIIMQFINESFILCFVSFLLALVLLKISLPLFNSLAGKQIQLAQALDGRLLLYFVALFLLIIGLTGIYPAVVVSRFNPSEVLYNRQKLSGRSVLGRSLVVLQFSLALCLLIATIVYYSQMAYIRTKDLGYNPNQIIRTNINGDRDYHSAISYLKNQFAKEPSINAVSFGNDGYPENIEADGKNVKAQYKNVDENFLSVMQVPLLAGSNIGSSFSAYKNEVMVNETFVKRSGIENPVGAQIKVYRYGDSVWKTITGVVKDFHFASLREPIAPMVMYASEVPDGGIWIRFNQSKQKEAMKAIERIYKEGMPGAVYQYNFLDKLNAKQYFQEQRWQQIVSVATILSFIICCLGLFGFAHLSANQRIKEIGVRKVLGASVGQIVTLLSGDFLKPVVVAFLIASPISWIIMNRWLQDYAYRVNIGWAVFAVAGFFAVVVALLTVCFQATKVAMANPVKSLRTE